MLTPLTLCCQLLGSIIKCSVNFNEHYVPCLRMHRGNRQARPSHSSGRRCGRSGWSWDGSWSGSTPRGKTESKFLLILHRLTSWNISFGSQFCESTVKVPEKAEFSLCMIFYYYYFIIILFYYFSFLFLSFFFLSGSGLVLHRVSSHVCFLRKLLFYILSSSEPFD